MELAERKARGAFYTPPAIAQYLCDWAIRSRLDRVLEPSCGDAEFLLAAGRSGARLPASLFNVPLSLTAVELNPDAAALASKRLANAGVSATIKVGDFFDLESDERYDAVIGNPPYIRYQQFSGAARAKALRSALTVGVSLNGLASSWAAFVIHSAKLLVPSGRLALVLPAELLTVKYAAPVRDYLLRRFARIQMITFEERVFAGVQEEVVLLLAEGAGPTTKFEVFPATSDACLSAITSTSWRRLEISSTERWFAALMPSGFLASYGEFNNDSDFSTLAGWGTTYLGTVTGNNDYFALRASEVDSLGLKEEELRKISPPGSKHLRSTTFSEKAWAQLARADAKCFLFYPSARPSAAAAKYIKSGELQKVQDGYKCSVRDPWWRVPLVETADLFLTYMDAERPRLVHNMSSVYHLNSLYGVRLKSHYWAFKKLIPLASINSLTTLGAEIIGRSYGGGILKLEPREADNLPIPSPDLIRSRSTQLESVSPQVARLVAQGKLMAACAVVDSILFHDNPRINGQRLTQIRQTREFLRGRRRIRATKHGKS